MSDRALRLLGAGVAVFFGFLYTVQGVAHQLGWTTTYDAWKGPMAFVLLVLSVLLRRP